jgi:plastocyanin
MKRLMASVVLVSLLTLLIAACGSSASANSNTTGSNTGSSSGSNTAVVQMGTTNFLQSSVTLNKGENLKLVDTGSVLHILNPGSWVNGTPTPATQKGLPTLNNLQFTGNDSHVIGPFNTAGTYHIYCTIHPGMNLTVIVK